MFATKIVATPIIKAAMLITRARFQHLDQIILLTMTLLCRTVVATTIVKPRSPCRRRSSLNCVGLAELTAPLRAPRV